MMGKHYLTLARSKLQTTTKKLCAVIFYNNISDIVEFLKKNFPDKIPLICDIDKEFNALLKNKGSIVTINDNMYPKLLKNISSAPIILSVKGNIDALNYSFIAVVGSRKLDKNDFAIIKSITSTINDCDCSIVSGLACGTDIVAHIHGMRHGTVAVLPCGLQNCYPREHQIILDKIIDFGGAVISEFSFFEPPKRYNFIQRNSTIVGMANAVVIARARSIKSGTMSSANFAKKFNREIYTLIFNGESDGNKYILSTMVATEITNFDDFKCSIVYDVAKKEYESANSTGGMMCDVIDINKSASLFTNIGNASIDKETQNILIYAEKALNIKPNEKNLPILFSICQQELQAGQDDQKTIMKILLKKCCK